ncbi:hypothetical protein [Tabrizicola oligotrophica]|uniref:hypothetical protein n=1 Tax=Tabrizicola oligotrophica TaxID=2710650 RepID=UPI0013E00813|nr:hypothetical protein [Tabrizicola oligotrophica]
MNFIWLMRMSRWARKPPSMGRVKFVLAIVAVCFALWGIERVWGWPEALTVNGKLRP